ncbi:MAG: hypothetical protein ACRENK_17010 [Gemmatimonadaceae bacterium]
MNFWWLEIPLNLRRFSTLLWAAWSDGLYLTAWPRLATLLVFAALAFGFAEGATHWSYLTIVGTNGFAGNVLAPMATANDWGGGAHVVFADNLVLLMVAVAVGSLSANLGVTLVLGYALGDILVAGPAPANLRFNDVVAVWISRHVPLLTSYILFFLLAALPIVMATQLARSAHPRVARSRFWTVGLSALIQGALIYCWGAVAPMVFRTVALWSGGDPRITVPFYRHIIGTWVVPTAIVAVLARGLIATSAVQNLSFRAKLVTAKAIASAVRLRVPKWARALITAALITLLMTGFLDLRRNWKEAHLFSNYVEAYVVFIGLALVFLAHAYVLPGMRQWQEWVGRVEQYPALLRLAVATTASYLLCLALVAIPGLQSSASGEFGPEVTAVLVGLGLTLVLLPEGWGGRPPGKRVLPWSRVPMPSRTTQVGIVGILLVLVSKKAYADCYDFACCMAGAAKAAAAAAAGGIPSLAGVAAATGATQAAAAASRSARTDAWKRAHLPQPDGPPTMGPQKPGTTPQPLYPPNKFDPPHYDSPPVFQGFDPGSPWWHKLGQLDSHMRNTIGWYQDHGSDGRVRQQPQPGSANPEPPGGWVGDGL